MTQTNLNLYSLAVGQVWSSVFNPNMKREIREMSCNKSGDLYITCVTFINWVEQPGLSGYPAYGFATFNVLTRP